MLIRSSLDTETTSRQWMAPPFDSNPPPSFSLSPSLYHPPPPFPQPHSPSLPQAVLALVASAHSLGRCQCYCLFVLTAWWLSGQGVRLECERPGFESSLCSGFFSGFVCWLVGCLTSQQHASVSQGRICTDNFPCYHTEMEVEDQTFYLTQAQYTDTGPTSPSADLIMPGAWQGSHWNDNYQVTGMTRPEKKSRRKRDSNPGSSAPEADSLTTRPARRCFSGSSHTIVT